MKRCAWRSNDDLLIAYHDHEWGVPVHDDDRLFEFLILEGAQAGLSRTTILKKRENYRRAYDDFDIDKVAGYISSKVKRLLNAPGIVRNKLKINAAIVNAKAAINIQKEFGSFNKYLWGFVDGKQVVNKRKILTDIPLILRQIICEPWNRQSGLKVALRLNSHMLILKGKFTSNSNNAINPIRLRLSGYFLVPSSLRSEGMRN